MADAVNSLASRPDACPGCGSQSALRGPVASHVSKHNRIEYTLFRCEVCDLHCWAPLRADPSIYTQEGFEAYADYHSGSRPFPRWAEPLFEQLPAQRGPALDIGCGDGTVLARLREHGFVPFGIDLDPQSIESARRRFKLTDVRVSTLEELQADRTWAAQPFAVVTFFEVLEHQDAPLSFLRGVAGLCGVDTMVAGSVPNRNRFLGWLDNRLGEGDLPPHHFLRFSDRALARMLRTAGYREVVVRHGGQLGLAEVRSRLLRVLQRRLRGALVPLATIAAVVLAPFVWLGFRVWPSHLFFTCRAGSESVARK